MSKNLEDIARLAGVSRSTVSRVINGHPHVSELTRRRVMEVVKREGFFPNPAARTLVTQRTRVLGFITPQALPDVFADPYFPALIQGISSTANQYDYALMLWLGEGAEEEERFYYRIRQTGLIDGVVVASVVDDDPLIAHFVEDRFPFVLIGPPPREGLNSIDIDNRHAARVAVEHLIHLGYQRIGMITGWLKMPSARARLDGYRDALRMAGRSASDSRIAEGNFLEPSGYMGMKMLLHQDVDAVFCASDTMAVGAMRALHEERLRVPDDVALVGFDDLPISAALSPPLTTIRQPIRRLGSVATEALINLLDGALATPYHVLLPTELVIRGSCGAMLKR